MFINQNSILIPNKMSNGSEDQYEWSEWSWAERHEWAEWQANLGIL